MGKSIPQYLGQLDIRKSVVSLATGAGAIYLLYKAIKAGIKCKPPLCTNSPICIARECPGPGERALPQEAPAPEASAVGGPKGDTSKFLFPLSFSSPPSSSPPCSVLGKALLEMLAQGPWISLKWILRLISQVSKCYISSGSQDSTSRKLGVSSSPHFLPQELEALRKGKIGGLTIGPELPLVHMFFCAE